MNFIVVDKMVLEERDCMDIIASSFEKNTNLVMLKEEMVSEDFFNLKTGLAGAILQKFTNYRIKAALVLKDDKKLIGRFKEMADELNKGNGFRIFLNEAEAEKWLLS